MSAAVQSSDKIAEARQRALFECEQAVLGGLMIDASLVQRMTLQPGDFLAPNHAKLYAGIRAVSAHGGVPDAVSVSQYLSGHSADDVNWLVFAASIQNNTPSAANTEHYAERIAAASMARKAQVIAASLSRQCATVDFAGNGPQDAVDQAIKGLISLNSGHSDWECHQYEAMESALEYMDKAASGFLGVSYGIREIDKKVGGMHGGDFVVIAARPAMGKTALMLNMAASGEPMGIISGEQGRTQIGMRILSINGRISLHNMRRGQLDQGEWSRLTSTMKRLKESPVWLYDKAGPTIEDVCRQARLWRYSNGAKLVMVDYLQKIRGGGGGNRAEQVGDVAARLKDLARELDIPVVALAQVNRNVEGNDVGVDGMGRMPFMGDIRESGVVEAEADTVLTLYRPGVYLPEDDRFKNVAFVNVCKSRHGPVGKIGIGWRGEYLQFGDLATTEVEA